MDIEKLLANLQIASPQVLRELKQTIEQLERMETIEECRSDFLAFVRRMWPQFLESAHHRKMAKAFQDVVEGRKKRIIINIRPRVGKSELTSIYLPAWFIGKFPHKKIMQATHNSTLATKYGRKVRDLIKRQEYQEIFPGTDLKQDTKAAGRWETTQGGEYYAAGVDAGIAGHGADLCVIDDPHSEQDGKTGNRSQFDAVYDWYTSGPRQRLQPGGAVLLVMTRWHKADLTGRVLRQSIENQKADQWEVIEFPAILPSGATLFPELWPPEEVLQTKETLPPQQWNAQYMQNPTSEESALIKREWWQRWEHEKPPECTSLIMAWDTAFEAGEKSDYSAMTLWGVFYREVNEKPVANLMLLDAWRERLEFPDLKRAALSKWKKHQPDVFLVEQRASGAPLIYELRSMGIPVTGFTPTKSTGDKVVRVNAITDLFSSKLIWAPRAPWAEEVIQECAEFPSGDHDDLVDTVSLALSRFRKGGFIRAELDQDDEKDRLFKRRKYYW